MYSIYCHTNCNNVGIQSSAQKRSEKIYIFQIVQ